MPMNPMIFNLELIYTTIVVVLCFFVYYRTREIYELTKYRGIQYFRNSFLLFGWAYASRFIFHLLRLGIQALDVHIRGHMLFPFVLVITSYLSTLAIFYLAYSTIWKRIRYEQFLMLANAIAVIVSLVSWMSNSPFTIMLVQLPLLVFTLVVILFKHKRKRSNTKVLYFLMTLFWLINLYILGPRWMIAFEVRLLLQLLSLVVFFTVVYKVMKWVR